MKDLETTYSTEIELKSFIDLSKKDITALADRNVNLWVEDGVDTLKIQSMIVKLGHYASELKERLSKALLEEVARDKVKSINGVEFSVANTSKYDYSNSPAWVEIDKQMNPLRDKLKKIEAIAKNTQTRVEWTDDDGTCYLIFPAVSQTAETVKCTIK